RQGTAVDLHQRAAVPQPGRTQRPDLLTDGRGGPAHRAAVPHSFFLSRPKTPRTTCFCNCLPSLEFRNEVTAATPPAIAPAASLCSAAGCRCGAAACLGRTGWAGSDLHP